MNDWKTRFTDMKLIQRILSMVDVSRIDRLSRQTKKESAWRELGRMEGRKEAKDDIIKVIKYAVRSAMTEWENEKDKSL